MAILDEEQRAVVNSFEQLPDVSKPAAMRAMTGALPDTSTGKVQVWRMLFTVLGIVLVVFAGGAVFLLLDGKETGAAMILAPISAIIAGLLGLFAPSPASSTRG